MKRFSHLKLATSINLVSALITSTSVNTTIISAQKTPSVAKAKPNKFILPENTKLVKGEERFCSEVNDSLQFSSRSSSELDKDIRNSAIYRARKELSARWKT
ncbi:hypothetical protein CDAR_580241 [Caerostris darwini]|uniref:Uncharacterized protein n=1 Tax=Caerostris darwini TaxID=1538125 RepID=A0AAV4QN40_9ARAC|nr:hypothetical protein CDAR_580241 [Caerostris darwini]